ncbi:MAG: prepilin-type N-terminal cleavage/methylation domain-containing protein [Candidatus Pacebacteria bacterium]|nr:prepilin-type N-terminal cleavage/methylation domain-containing protein [Candidatus Paceibacterota bacterium]
MQNHNSKFKDNNRSSFTLLELLVVIAIIAILAGVVIASVVDLRQRAKESKGMQFSQNIRTTLSNELVGEWKFDEETNPGKDSSGYNHHGVVYTGLFPGGAVCNDYPDPSDPSCPVWISNGKVGGALQFDGVDDSVRVTGDTILNLSKGTIEAWFRISSMSGGISFANSGSWADERFVIHLGHVVNGKIKFTIANGSGYILMNSLTTPSMGQWYHVVVTFNGSKKSIYINGQLDNEQNTTLVPSTQNVPFFIGMTRGLAPDYFSGAIDEVRVYARELTAREIKQFYAEGLPRHLADNDK